MIQDIGDNRFDITFKQKESNQDSIFFTYKNGAVLMQKKEEQFSFPNLGQLDEAVASQARFGFEVNEEPFFLLDEEALDDEIPEGFEYVGLRSLFAIGPEWAPLAAVTGSHLNHWYKEHRYCGCCGGTMKDSDKERAVMCRDCGNIQYPRINPVIMAAVTDGDRILVTRYAGREYKGLALIAGFVEIGENLEAALAREVMEEVGLKVKNLSYFGSQPWGFSDSVISGFFAELDGSNQVRLDRDELSEAVWLSREELPPQDTRVSITAAMIEDFRTGKR